MKTRTVIASVKTPSVYHHQLSVLSSGRHQHTNATLTSTCILPEAVRETNRFIVFGKRLFETSSEDYIGRYRVLYIIIIKYIYYSALTSKAIQRRCTIKPFTQKM